MVDLYSVNNKNSVDTVKRWIEQVIHSISKTKIIVLVGVIQGKENERVISSQEGVELAESFGIPFIEVSSETGYNVDILLEMILENLVQSISHSENKQTIDSSKKEKDHHNNCIII